VAQGIGFANNQKQIIADNTGINDILSGTAGEGTLGTTLIMKEAALNRLIIPRNSVVSGIQQDAYMTVSWIQQTYTVEKVSEFSTSDELDQFVANNPQYFIEDLTKKSHEGDDTELDENEGGEDRESGYGGDHDTENQGGKYRVAYSKKARLNFDIKFNPQDENSDQISELTDEYDIPLTKLFEILDSRGHTSDRIEIVIDPTSTLLPSDEINKQRITQLYQLVGPATAQIIQGMTQLPDLSRALLVQLEQILTVNGESIYDWFPQDIYNSIMNPTPQNQPPSPNQVATGQPQQQGPMSQPIPQSGGPSVNGGPMGFTGIGGQPAMNRPQPQQPLGSMAQEFGNAIQQAPLQSAMNASIGRAAKGNVRKK
jgi:hypothetical protein